MEPGANEGIRARGSSSQSRASEPIEIEVDVDREAIAGLIRTERELAQNIRSLSERLNDIAASQQTVFAELQEAVRNLRMSIERYRAAGTRVTESGTTIARPAMPEVTEQLYGFGESRGITARSTQIVTQISDILEDMGIKFAGLARLLYGFKPEELGKLIGLVPEKFREDVERAFKKADLHRLADVLAKVPEETRTKFLGELEALASKNRLLVQALEGYRNEIARNVENTGSKFAQATAYAIPILGHALMLHDAFKSLGEGVISIYRTLRVIGPEMWLFAIQIRNNLRALASALRQAWLTIVSVIARHVLPRVAPALGPLARGLGGLTNALAQGIRRALPIEALSKGMDKIADILGKQILRVMEGAARLSRHILPRIPSFFAMLLGAILKGTVITGFSSAALGALGAKIGGAVGGAIGGIAAKTGITAVGGLAGIVGGMALAIASAVTAAGKIGEALGVTADKIMAGARVIEAEGGKLSSVIAYLAADLWTYADQLKQTLPPIIGDIAQGLYHGAALLMVAYARASGWVEAGLRQIADRVTETGSWIWARLTEAGRLLAQGLMSLGNVFAGAIMSISHLIAQGAYAVINALASIASSITNAGTWVIQNMVSVFASLFGVVRGIVDNILGALGGVGDWIRSAFSGTNTAINNAIQSLTQFSKNLALPSPRTYGGIDSIISSGISNIANILMSSSREQASMLKEAILSGFRSARIQVNVAVKDKEVRVNTNYG